MSTDPFDEQQRVLVVGGTGQTGRIVVQRLIDRGCSVRVLTRSAERVLEVVGPMPELHVGDARDPSSLAGLADDIDVALLLMGTRTYFGANGGLAVDAEGTRNLMALLSAARVRHVVLLSAFGLDRSSAFLRIFSVLLGGYFEHKEAAERAVRTAGLPYTIVRPVELRNRPPRGLALLNQAGSLSLLRTVSRETVAEVMVFCAGNSDAVDRSFELCEGGAEGLGIQLARMRVDLERPIPVSTPLWSRSPGGSP